MAERRKNRKRKDEVASLDTKVAQDKPSKEEYAVAKWIRSNVPSKKTKFDRAHNVEYFTGSRAIDALLENSPWTTVFENREQVSQFLDLMLRHKFFHRAKKVVISEEELNKMRGIKKKTKDDKKPAEKEDPKENKDAVAAKDEKSEEKAEERKEHKKKPKVRLEMHMDQYFVDCNDAYVWIYEPIPVYYWFFGTLVVLGRCHLWLLPNLTADVGFFASFWPLYQYEYYGPSDNDKKSSKKKRKKEKDSDSEDAPLLHSEEISNATESPKEDERIEELPSPSEEKKVSSDSAEGEDGSEEGSESEKSNTGRDFVMV
ncbi:Translocation protein SEC62 [Camponotus japonicus]